MSSLLGKSMMHHLPLHHLIWTIGAIVGGWLMDLSSYFCWKSPTHLRSRQGLKFKNIKMLCHKSDISLSRCTLRKRKTSTPCKTKQQKTLQKMTINNWSTLVFVYGKKTDMKIVFKYTSKSKEISKLNE